ncbi:unnamed protein product [Caenorhabditis angaria]|uniref:Domain of unknown function DX domain-containing protein n=1 Tax=Caenorhabditis angaria TaxID=860376 RepID=A0A9P1N193_9PELO|nr:unnamed protein product [Caenorhabditis angaria]
MMIFRFLFIFIQFSPICTVFVSEILKLKAIVNPTMKDNTTTNKYYEAVFKSYEGNPNATYKRCFDNEECDDNNYCLKGTILSMNGKTIESKISYCFDVPHEYYLYRDSKPTKCNNDENCEGGYCKSFAQGSNLKLCASIPVCPNNLASLNKQECSSNYECPANSKCMKSMFDDRKTCCPQESLINKCKYGIPVFPIKNCPCQFANQNNKINQVTEWCDEESNICCEVNQLQRYLRFYCLDAKTPLYSQPDCNGTFCEENDGICIQGRCCPKLLYNEIDHVYKGLPSKPYKTGVDCIFENDTNPNWPYTFCEEKTKKIWIIGKKTTFGESIKMVAQKCAKATDCDKLNNRKNQYCVLDSTGKSYCIDSPIVAHVKSAQFSLWHINDLVTAILFLGILCACSIMVIASVRWCIQRKRRMEQFY